MVGQEYRTNKMKILYVHQLFKTPKEGGGIRSWYLAKALVKAGHEVNLISSHQTKNEEETVDGIKVHYTRIAYDNSFGFARRLWAYGSFVLKARAIARGLEKQDLAYVMTTPLTTGWIATWIKRKLSVPYFFEVGDLWPDVPIEMGVIKSSFLKKWLYKKEKEFYDEAEKVIALSPDIAENIITKTKTSVQVIPNMADTEFYQPVFRSKEVSLENPLQILYCGAHGRANHLEYLIDAARASQQLPIHFILMGAGSEKARLMKLSEGLKNITFQIHGSKSEVKHAMESCDAIYVSFQNLKTLHTGSPNKFFDALAAGKMVFTNLDGWIAGLIQEHNLGFSHSGGRPDEFSMRIVDFLSLESIVQAQKNAYLLSKDYSINKLSTRLLESLEDR
jgi:glycosyltransferase involved in cell wall biosynthesis